MAANLDPFQTDICGGIAQGTCIPTVTGHQCECLYGYTGEACGGLIACTCNNGHVVEGPLCTGNGQEYCIHCNENWVLDAVPEIDENGEEILVDKCVIRCANNEYRDYTINTVDGICIKIESTVTFTSYSVLAETWTEAFRNSSTNEFKALESKCEKIFKEVVDLMTVFKVFLGMELICEVSI